MNEITDVSIEKVDKGKATLVVALVGRNEHVSEYADYLYKVSMQVPKGEYDYKDIDLYIEDLSTRKDMAINLEELEGLYFTIRSILEGVSVNDLVESVNEDYSNRIDSIKHKVARDKMISNLLNKGNTGASKSGVGGSDDGEFSDEEEEKEEGDEEEEDEDVNDKKGLLAFVDDDEDE